MRRLHAIGYAVLLFCLSAAAVADQLFMVRSVQSFPEAMTTLQGAIVAHGYKVSRVQRVDIGLTESGFETDKYRIVFFGKSEQVLSLTERYPQLIPYLPWPITIFAEGEETLLVTSNPTELNALADTEELQQVFNRLSGDIRAILDEVRKAE